MAEREHERAQARHELGTIDELAMIAARAADRLLAEARARASERWMRFLEPIPDRLRDEQLPALRRVALRARAAYGAKDSIRDTLPAEVTEPFLEAIDRLLREVNRVT